MAEKKKKTQFYKFSTKIDFNFRNDIKNNGKQLSIYFKFEFG